MSRVLVAFLSLFALGISSAAPGSPGGEPQVPSLVFSTYFGTPKDDFISAVTLDDEGFIYLAGRTYATEIPDAIVLGPLAPGEYAYENVLVLKLTPDGSQVVFATILGGTLDDAASAIAVDSERNVWVAGYTASADFPAAAARLSAGPGGGSDVFLTKLDPSGGAQLFSATVGGAQSDEASAILLAPEGGVYLSGTTNSSDFPLVNPIYPHDHQQFTPRPFVVRVAAGRSSLEFSTLIGTALFQSATGLVLGRDGTLFVAGTVLAHNFPYVNYPAAIDQGGLGGYLVRLTADGREVLLARTIGGRNWEHVDAVGVDAAGQIYIAGYTNSHDFPVVDPLQAPDALGDLDAFVMCLDAEGTTTRYATVLGGRVEDACTAMHVSPAGVVTIAGYTMSADFPVAGGPAEGDWPLGGSTDLFVARLAPGGSALVYSRRLGGSSWDYFASVAADADGDVVLAAATSSDDLPTRGALQAEHAGLTDGFLAQLRGGAADIRLAVNSAPESAARGATVTYRLTATNGGPEAADGAAVRVSVPAGATFAGASTTAGEVEAPRVGGEGEVAFRIGRMAAGATTEVSLTVRVAATAGTVLALEASSAHAGYETAPGDGAVRVETAVTPGPAIAEVQLETSPKLRIVIQGSNFQPGAQVFVGDSTTSHPVVKYRGPERLELAKPKLLRRALPIGVAVPVRVVNPDGGEAAASVTR